MSFTKESLEQSEETKVELCGKSEAGMLDCVCKS